MENEISTLQIEKKIFVIRGVQVMIDRDIAELYGVETKVLNQAVKRNITRFPDEFMFQLTRDEIENLKSQFVTSSWGGTRKLPYAFTEQGVAMLASVLKTKTAVDASVKIIRAFVAMRHFIMNNANIFAEIKDLGKKVSTFIKLSIQKEAFLQKLLN